MEKSANLRVRLQPELHREFIATCKAMNVNGSAVIRQCIEAFVERHRDDAQTDLFNPKDQQNR